MEGKTLISLFYNANKIMKYSILNRIICESKTGFSILFSLLERVLENIIMNLMD